MDLFTPATNPTGILDSMALANLLDEPGCAPELAGLGRARPLLREDRLLRFGYTLHFDVDVVDFLDLPMADIPRHNAGLALTRR